MSDTELNDTTGETLMLVLSHLLKQTLMTLDSPIDFHYNQFRAVLGLELNLVLDHTCDRL